MKKVIELVGEAIFQSSLTRHVVNLNIVSVERERLSGKLKDKYEPGYNLLKSNVIRIRDVR